MFIFVPLSRKQTCLCIGVRTCNLYAASHAAEPLLHDTWTYTSLNRWLGPYLQHYSSPSLPYFSHFVIWLAIKCANFAHWRCHESGGQIKQCTYNGPESKHISVLRFELANFALQDMLLNHHSMINWAYNSLNFWLAPYPLLHHSSPSLRYLSNFVIFSSN